MGYDQLKIALVVTEWYIKQHDVTSLIVAELGNRFEQHDSICHVGAELRREVVSRGFRPTAGGMEGKLRSELSREACIVVEGKSSEPLKGRFIVASGLDVSFARCSIQVTDLVDEWLLVREHPIIVRLSPHSQSLERGVGVLFVAGCDDDLVEVPRGLLYVFQPTAEIAFDSAIELWLGSSFVSEDRFCTCTLEGIDSSKDWRSIAVF